MVSIWLFLSRDRNLGQFAWPPSPTGPCAQITEGISWQTSKGLEARKNQSLLSATRGFWRCESGSARRARSSRRIPAWLARSLRVLARKGRHTRGPLRDMRQRRGENPPGRGNRPTLECGPLDRKLTALKLFSKRLGFESYIAGSFLGSLLKGVRGPEILTRD